MPGGDAPPPALGLLPWPGADTHKHRRGRCAVVSGPAGRTGAARLAARGALRIGAGLVTVLAPVGAMAEHAAQLNAIMLRPLPAHSMLEAEAAGFHAVVVGPAGGVGAETRAVVAALARGGAGALVVDADALTSFEPDPGALFAALRPGDVLTPHEGEFARLFPDLTGEREARAAAAAGRAGCVVVLKGAQTVIAGPGGALAVNRAASPWLATAGSGDVLAGFIAGLLAGGVPSFDAATLAVWLHGRLGQRLGPGLIAEDLPEALPALLNELAPEPLKRQP